MRIRSRLKLTLLTGFLGSGKTTLLRRVLSQTGGAGIAVIVNEFADIGLDDELIFDACDASLLISGGCVCCDRREELLAALRRLLDDHERGALAGLRRVVIETSGLADPAPIVMSIDSDAVLRYHFDLDAIVAVVDGLAGVEQLKRHPEARKQIGIADQVLISKVDLASAEQLLEVHRLLAALNPAANVGRVDNASRSLLTNRTRTFADAYRDDSDPVAGHSHTPSVASLSLSLDQPLDWVAFGVWLSMLLHAHGQELLRVKGIVDASGVGAVAINAVQNLIYPPEHIGTPLESRQSKLVFIARDLAPQSIARSLRAFQQLG